MAQAGHQRDHFCPVPLTDARVNDGRLPRNPAVGVDLPRLAPVPRTATVTLELVHGLAQELWSVVRKQGMHEDDITTGQAALYDWADLVQERLVERGAAEPLCKGGNSRTDVRLCRWREEDQVDQTAEDRASRGGGRKAGITRSAKSRRLCMVFSCP